MVSGQSPNFQNQADCQFFNDVTPGTPMSDGQVFGTGCVYPPGVETVGNQLGHAGYQWKGYMEDMNANAPKGQQSPCRHPAIGQRRSVAERDAHGRVRDPSQPVRVLPLAHRLQQDLPPARRRLLPPAQGPEAPRDESRLRIDRPRPVQRRPRRARARTGSPAGSSPPTAGCARRCRGSFAPRPSSTAAF